MYDGYTKYRAIEASSYEEERKKEPLWWQEEQFISDYFIHHNKLSKILDAPVGTGRFLQYYHQAQEVIGIDISEEMLKESRLKLDNTCLKNVRLAHGDIFKLDFVDNYFDVTICWRFCHLVPVEYLHHALKELGRVTSGEILLQAYIGRPYWKRLLTSLFRFPGKFYMKLKGSRSAPLPWSHIHAYFHTDQLLASKIAEAGLVINRQVKIGPYNDSIVSVYHLRKW